MHGQHLRLEPLRASTIHSAGQKRAGRACASKRNSPDDVIPSQCAHAFESFPIHGIGCGGPGDGHGADDGTGEVGDGPCGGRGSLATDLCCGRGHGAWYCGPYKCPDLVEDEVVCYFEDDVHGGGVGVRRERLSGGMVSRLDLKERERERGREKQSAWLAMERRSVLCGVSTLLWCCTLRGKEEMGREERGKRKRGNRKESNVGQVWRRKG